MRRRIRPLARTSASFLFFFSSPMLASSQDARTSSCDSTDLAVLRSCAEQGDAESQFRLGVAYQNGRGVPVDDTESVRWYRLAAEQGLAKAQNNLGLMYAQTVGTYPRDDEAAARWFRLAAEQGDQNAQTNLGGMYTDGRGVPRDDAEAARWYRLAAEQGNGRAQLRLGLMYANGEGVTEDDIVGYMWLSLGALVGGEEVRQARDSVASDMTPAQIAEAERLSREWLSRRSPGG
jgi:TPR repeat protein